VQLANTYPEAPSPQPPVDGLHPAASPYLDDRLFHGPAFQRLVRLEMGDRGSRSLLDATPGPVPVGTLAPALLDAALHGIPHDRLAQWCDAIAPDKVAYPTRVVRARFFGATPEGGEVSCRASLAGLEPDGSPRFALELTRDGRVWATVELIEALFPLGPLGGARPDARRAFLERRGPVAGVALARRDGHATHLSRSAVSASDWLPGTLARCYALSQPRASAVREIAAKEHVAQSAGIHPSLVSVDASFTSAIAASAPFTRVPLQVSGVEDVVVSDGGPPRFDLAPLRQFWDRRLGVGPSVVTDLFYALIERFVAGVHVEDPARLRQLRDRPVLFLANHQTAIESPLFRMIGSAVHGSSIVTLVKAEHRTSWIGELASLCSEYPGVSEPNGMVFFDRQNRAALPAAVQELLGNLAAGRSVLVHVEGTRAVAANQPVVKLSSIWADLAIERDIPIVPIRFSGGLPQKELTTRLEFPLAFGAQDYSLGRPILPEELRALSFAERKGAITAAINRIGPAPATESPIPGDRVFGARVAELAARSLSAEQATLLAALERLSHPSDETRQLIAVSRWGATAGAGAREAWLARFADWLFGSRALAAVG
jgi:1-acyl-sn-glycerol-3-phosphate acyltransferase